MLKGPRLADVQCTKLQFNEGDRILVRTYERLDNESKQKLTKTIQKWAGCNVHVLIYSALDMDIKVESAGYK